MGEDGHTTPNSLSRESNHTISQVALAIERYSASADDRETVCCFLDFQDTKEEPRKTQKPDVDLQVSGQVAQSESDKKLSLRSEVEL